MFGDKVMSTNCDFIFIFLIYGQFGEIQKPDFGCFVCKIYIFINSSLLSYKNWKQNWKHSSHTIDLNKGTVFAKKMVIFFQKEMLTSAKLKGSWYYKVYFLKLHMCAYLRTKFLVSSIIQTRFRQSECRVEERVIPLPQNGPLKSPPRLGLKCDLLKLPRRSNVIFARVRNSNFFMENFFQLIR